MRAALLPSMSAYAPSVTGSGGGGPAPGGLVSWGPDFGEPNGSDGITYRFGSNVDLDKINPINTKNIQDFVDLDALILRNQHAVKDTVLHDLVVRNQSSVVDTFDFDSIAVINERQAGSSVDLDALVAANSSSPQIHLSGSVLGAPFWQSIERTATGGSGAGAITINKPAGTVEGDLMLLISSAYNLSGLPTINGPAGWTTIRDNTILGNQRMASYWKIAGPSEPASYDVTFTVQNGTPGYGEIHRIIGTDPTTPMNVSQHGSASVIDAIVPAVTTTVANCLVFAAIFHDHLATDQTHATPASHTIRTNQDLLQGALHFRFSSATRVFAAAASTGTVTWDCNELVATNAVYQRIAIAPGLEVIAA